MPPPDISRALHKLAASRPAFHSEADLQHALAWQLQLEDRGAAVRLERQVAAPGKPRVHLDLQVMGEDYHLAIELKYKTRLLHLQQGDESFFLRNQSAQDIGRHDFIKDVHRLEQYVQDHPDAIGVALLLTNDSSYWQPSQKKNAVDSLFRLHEGRSLTGTVRWGAAASAGTTRSRDIPLDLRGQYALGWADYSQISESGAGKFRYLRVDVIARAGRVQSRLAA